MTVPGPRSKALIVGINYTGTSSELRGCVSDAVNIRRLLIEQKKVADRDILFLCDDGKCPAPTRANILRAWEWLLTTLPAADFSTFTTSRANPKVTTGYKLYFTYSGHGTQIRDLNRDETDRKDEALVPLDYLRNGCISDDVIRSYVNRLPSGSSLFGLIDACHSATSFDLAWQLEPGRWPLRRETYEKQERYVDTVGDIVVLSGSKDSGTSADLGVQGGALTIAFLNLARKPLPPSDVFLESIRRDVRRLGTTQVPCLTSGYRRRLELPIPW